MAPRGLILRKRNAHFRIILSPVAQVARIASTPQVDPLTKTTYGPKRICCQLLEFALRRKQNSANSGRSARNTAEPKQSANCWEFRPAYVRVRKGSMIFSTHPAAHPAVVFLLETAWQMT